MSVLQQNSTFKIPVLLLLNKIDNSNQEQLEKQVAFWTESA
jgi:GTP-binding protein Era